MEGRIIPTQIALELQGTFLDDETCFHFIEDIYGKYYMFTSPEYEEIISQTQYNYLLDYPFSLFEPKPTPDLMNNI